MRPFALALALIVLLASGAAADEKLSKAEIEKRLDEKKVTLNFPDTPLEDALVFLQDITGVPFEVDDAAKLAAGEAAVSLKLKDTKLRTALEQIVKSAGTLDYRIEEGRVLIILKGSKDKGK